MDGAGDFRKTMGVGQLAKRQQVVAPAKLKDLAGDWPADDSLDEFLDMVHQGRR